MEGHQKGRKRILEAMNDQLISLNEELLHSNSELPSLPPLLNIAFLPRSGSTYLAQCLAQTGGFYYVSNLMARFWKAPLFGAALDRDLGREEYGNEMSENEYGRTKGVHEPHEFGYFWNRWWEYFWERKGFENADRLKKELNALRRFSERPFFIKNSTPGRNPDRFQESFPEALTVYLKRDPLYLGQSVLYGIQEVGWDYHYLFPSDPDKADRIQAEKNPYRQVVQWVKAAEEDIEQKLKRLPQDKVLVLDYEKLCEAPEGEVAKILDLCSLHQGQRELLKRLPPPSNARDRRKISQESFNKLEKAFSELYR